MNNTEIQLGLINYSIRSESNLDIFHGKPLISFTDDQLGTTSKRFDLWSSSSKENELNDLRKIEMEKETSFFLSLLETTTFDDGITNEAIKYIESKMEVNKIVTREWLTDIFNDCYAKNNIEIVIKILKILSDYSLEQVKPNGQLMVLAAIKNKNRLVQASALSVLGHWMDKQTFEMIDNSCIESKWVQMIFDKISDQIKLEHVS